MVRITGIALGWIGSTIAFGAVFNTLDESLRAASDYSVSQAVLVPHGAGSSKIVVQPDASNVRRQLDPMSKWLPRDGGGPGIQKVVGRYFCRAEV